MKQRELSLWLKFIVGLAGVMGLFLCFWFAPVYGRMLAAKEPSRAYLFWPCLIYVWAACVPVYIALYEAWKIFTNIGKDKSFIHENVHRLKTITRLSIIEVVLYFGAAILLLLVDLVNIQIFIVIFIILFASMFVSVCASVLSHLVSKAVELQEENDLTI